MTAFSYFNRHFTNATDEEITARNLIQDLAKKDLRSNSSEICFCILIQESLQEV